MGHGADSRCRAQAWVRLGRGILENGSAGCDREGLEQRVCHSLPSLGRRYSSSSLLLLVLFSLKSLLEMQNENELKSIWENEAKQFEA